MRKTISVFVLVNVFTLVTLMCGACIPPFIDGLVEAQDYFESAVQCSIYTINPEADGGFETTAGDALQLNELTDGIEDNIAMLRYYSFTFRVKKDIELQTVAFIVEATGDALLEFQLSHYNSIFNRSIDLASNSIGTVVFSDLNLHMVASDEFSITLSKPLLSQVVYRIDTVLFVI